MSDPAGAQWGKASCNTERRMPISSPSLSQFGGQERSFCPHPSKRLRFPLLCWHRIQMCDPVTHREPHATIEDARAGGHDYEIVEPSASPILESLRAFGYSPQTALADLIDNSISASAFEIRVQLHWMGSSSWISITDNGDGMDEKTLVAAMRLGSQSPLNDRSKGDLGRFGLGLKTASFSQGRQLTVMSRTPKAENLHVRQWDLDVVQRTDEWRLLTEAPSEISESMAELLPDSGTVVALGKLDRMLDKVFGAESAGSQADFLKIVDSVRRHLELVFHRYLSRSRPVRIWVNGQQLIPWDPFLRSHMATSTTGKESIWLAGYEVVVEPFVLPHKSKLSEAEHEAAAGLDGWNASQGFYVYRKDRLLVGGSWLGVGGAKEEHSKLARIAIEIPSTLDHLWQVDVRKSSIKAPSGMLGDLRRIARATKKDAEEVYRFRGKQTASRLAKEYVVAWDAIGHRSGGTSYRVNRRHPLVADALSDGLVNKTAVERLLRFVEETVPVTQIGIAVAESLDSTKGPFQDEGLEVRDQLEFMHQRQIAKGKSSSEALDFLATAEPFIYYLEIVQAFREDLE
ncbi:ATP-binding protein [Salinibacterium xinjiangense]|uniref:ATP-binding protein n=1 Tax=Salinibacterium xinjiangense TaxID=386302 RepID=UPI001C54801A|nr:ATP-binding protein [Salinibacterium xinjiangense]